MIFTANAKRTGLVSVIFTVLILCAVGVMFIIGEQDSEVLVLQDQISISGMYGLSVAFSEIEEVSLEAASMNQIGVGRRTNGYGGFGNTLKGHFSFGESQRVLLFVQADASPTLWIKCKSRNDIYISYGDSNKTMALYDACTAAGLVKPVE